MDWKHTEDGEDSVRNPCLQCPGEDCRPDNDDGFGHRKTWMGYSLKAQSTVLINRLDVGNEERIRNNSQVSCLNKWV